MGKTTKFSKTAIQPNNCFGTARSKARYTSHLDIWWYFAIANLADIRAIFCWVLMTLDTAAIVVAVVVIVVVIIVIVIFVIVIIIVAVIVIFGFFCSNYYINCNLGLLVFVCNVCILVLGFYILVKKTFLFFIILY